MNYSQRFVTLVTLSTITMHLAFDMPDRNSSPVEKAWHEKAAQWLVSSQSPDGGWGNASHAPLDGMQAVATAADPATTAFAAMALLEAGGSLATNPYQENILASLDYILHAVEHRPGNGRITELTNTQPQRKLGMHVDASMALDFLTAIRPGIHDTSRLKQIDTAAHICITLLAASQNPNGQWKDGGWAPVLQDVVNVSSLENAAKTYAASREVNIKGSRANATDYYIDGISTLDGVSVDGRDAGVRLYNAASVLRGTAADALEAEQVLSEVRIAEIRKLPAKSINAIAASIAGTGVSEQKATRLAKAYKANLEAREVLREEATWVGFGSNGGEEYLSYKLYSETMELQNQADWMHWKKEIEPKFKSTQNPNGSWSGHHCITSPVFCTAAVLLAWHGAVDIRPTTAGR